MLITVRILILRLEILWLTILNHDFRLSVSANFKFSVAQVFGIAENIPYDKIPSLSSLNFQVSIFWFLKLCDFSLTHTSINKGIMLRLEKRCVCCSHFNSIEFKSFRIKWDHSYNTYNTWKSLLNVSVSMFHILCWLLAHVSLCFLGSVFHMKFLCFFEKFSL